MIGGEDVTATPVQLRDIGFVFQNYALFPHMTVAENIQYPLRIRKLAKREIAARVAEILDLVNLVGFENRKIDELSGGQQQRVAIGRALSYRPKVLLLDEPMGALDRKLRQQLGADLRRIQKETRTTALYVTHDQEEAFVLSDAIAIMNGGKILQTGSPRDLYRKPSTRFVADFLGQANFLEGVVAPGNGGAMVVQTRFGAITCRSGTTAAVGETLAVSVRPEAIQLFAKPSDEVRDRTQIGPLQVSDRIFLGNRSQIVLSGSQNDSILVETSGLDFDPEPGSNVYASWPVSASTVIAAR